MKILHLIIFFLSSFGSFSQTIKIADQYWSSKNLNVSKFRNGDAIRQAKSRLEWERACHRKIPTWCYYQFNEFNGKKYGKLYNWYALIDIRGLAPFGWHIPSNKEWQTLLNSFEGESEAYESLKSQNGWKWDVNGTNSSGFSALPGGYLGGSEFYEITEGARWWSSSFESLYYKDGKISHFLPYFCDINMIDKTVSLNRHMSQNYYGLYIRIIKDQIVQKSTFNNSINKASKPTEIVDVTNPKTGKTWMDRNLGATRAAKSPTDEAAYGDLYQWGRGADGHQYRNSGTTSTLSATDQPNDANFILTNSPYDWRSPHNDNLWQGVNGVNNPCPSGYRIPTYDELTSEIDTWKQNNITGAFNSPLKLPLSGSRSSVGGTLYNEGSYGVYWSSSVDGDFAWYLDFSSGTAKMRSSKRALGFSIRCIKD